MGTAESDFPTLGEAAAMPGWPEDCDERFAVRSYMYMYIYIDIDIYTCMYGHGGVRLPYARRGGGHAWLARRLR